MDIFDFITSRKVLVSNISDSSSPQVDRDSAHRDYEARWKHLKKVIRNENAKKQPCGATLKSAIDELRDLRRLLVQAGQSNNRRRPLVTCLENNPQESSSEQAVDWSDCQSLRQRGARRRRFFLYMPAGDEIGTDVSIGRERLEKIQEAANKNTYGPLDKGPTVTIAGVPQPMERFNNRRRR